MVWWIIIRIIMTAISFIQNVLFLFVLVRNKHLAKRKRITYHVANIAVADALYGLGRFCCNIVWLHGNGARSEIYLSFGVMWDIGYLASLAAVFLMTIERSIVITKPLIWNEMLPRKRMLLFMLCSWKAVVTLLAVYIYLWLIQYTWGEGSTVVMVINTLQTLFLLFTAAVNIYMFKKLRKKDGLADSQQSTRQLPETVNHQKSIHLRHKASILVLLLAVIMIVTCLPISLLRMIGNIGDAYTLCCNLYTNSTMFNVFVLLENLNFIVNPLVYIWKDRIYRNAFYRTFKIKTAQF